MRVGGYVDPQLGGTAEVGPTDLGMFVITTFQRYPSSGSAFLSHIQICLYLCLNREHLRDSYFCGAAHT